MAVFLLILKIIGFILLFVITLVAVILLLPVSAKIECKDGFVKIYPRILFFNINLYKDKQVSGESKREDDISKTGRKIDFNTIKEIWSSAKESIKILTKFMKVTDLEIEVRVSGSDEMTIGLVSGGIWAVLGTALGILQNSLRIKVCRIDVLPCFIKSEEDHSLFFSFNLKTFTLIIVLSVLKLVKFIRK